jgi:energy-coupling factor transporter ATP-binding protein EcfA2
VNGAISKLNRQDFFYMDPSASNSKILLPHIDKGEFIMFYGARGSGKTTRIFRMQEQLQENYAVIDTSLESGIDFRGYDQFWKSFGESLCHLNSSYKLPLIRSASDFSAMLLSKKSR